VRSRCDCDFYQLFDVGCVMGGSLSDSPGLVIPGQKLHGRAQNEAIKGKKVDVDYIAVLFPQDPDNGATDIRRVMVMLALMMGFSPGDWVHLDHGRYGYPAQWRLPNGASVLYGKNNEEGHPSLDVRVELSGGPCSNFGNRSPEDNITDELNHEESMRRFLRFCNRFGKVSRVDIYIDDYDKGISVETVRDWLAGREAVTHARTSKTVNETVIGTGERSGDTVYIGSRSGRQMIRVYDKDRESSGAVPAIRWELESKKECAQTLAVRLAEEDWGTVIASRVLSFVDFRSADSADSNVTRRERLPLFERLVQGARKASAYLAAPLKTAAEHMQYVSKYLGPSWAVAMDLVKGDLGWLSGILADGRSRYKPRHRALVLQGLAAG